jgi:mRNA-degrading endonuclease toxin of MazEF toxin-antitoxin module
MEQTGKRPVVIWQSDALTGVLASVLVVPLTSNLDRAHLGEKAFVGGGSGQGTCPTTEGFWDRANSAERLPI